MQMLLCAALRKHCVLLCFGDVADQYSAISCVLCVFVVLGHFGVRFSTGHKSKSVYFTVEMLCFGSARGAPEGGPGAPPGGRSETPKSCESVAFAAYLAQVTKKSL